MTVNRKPRSLLLNPVLQAVVYTAIYTHSGPQNSSLVLLPFPRPRECFIRKYDPLMSLEFIETIGTFAGGRELILIQSQVI